MTKKITFIENIYLPTSKMIFKIGAALMLGVVSVTGAFSQIASASFYSNFSDPTSHFSFSTPPDVTLGVNNFYNNPSYVANSSISDYSDLFILVGVNLANSNRMVVQADLNLNGNGSIVNKAASAGSQAGFLIDNSSGLLDVSVANQVVLTTYLNGVVQESSTSSNLIGVKIGGLFSTLQDIHFPTTKPYNSVGISVGLGFISVTALYDLRFYYAYTTAVTVLPVSLTSFTAQSEGKTVKLGWATASESNSKGFTVERSTDAVNFSEIGYVASKAVNGNSNTTLSYETRDENPLAGINYYRLKQLDIDGKSSPSIIVSANSIGGSALTAFKVFPNPATNLINIQAPSTGTYLVELFTIDGRKVQTSQLSTGGGLLNFNINKMGVKAGIYSVKVTNTNGKSSSFYNTVLIK